MLNNFYRNLYRHFLTIDWYIGVNQSQCRMEKMSKSGCLVCFKWPLQNVFVRENDFWIYVKLIYCVIATSHIFSKRVILMTPLSLFRFNFDLLIERVVSQCSNTTLNDKNRGKITYFHNGKILGSPSRMDCWMQIWISTITERLQMVISKCF